MAMTAPIMCLRYFSRKVGSSSTWRCFLGFLFRPVIFRSNAASSSCCLLSSSSFFARSFPSCSFKRKEFQKSFNARSKFATCAKARQLPETRDGLSYKCLFLFSLKTPRRNEVPTHTKGRLSKTGLEGEYLLLLVLVNAARVVALHLGVAGSNVVADELALLAFARTAQLDAF